MLLGKAHSDSCCTAARACCVRTECSQPALHPAHLLVLRRSALQQQLCSRLGEAGGRAGVCARRNRQVKPGALPAPQAGGSVILGGRCLSGVPVSTMPGLRLCTHTGLGPWSAAASCCSVRSSCAMAALVAPYDAYCGGGGGGARGCCGQALWSPACIVLHTSPQPVQQAARLPGALPRQVSGPHAPGPTCGVAMPSDPAPSRLKMCPGAPQGCAAMARMPARVASSVPTRLVRTTCTTCSGGSSTRLCGGGGDWGVGEWVGGRAVSAHGVRAG